MKKIGIILFFGALVLFLGHSYEYLYNGASPEGAVLTGVIFLLSVLFLSIEMEEERK